MHGLEDLHGVAVDDNDNIYVTDRATCGVYKFDSLGKKLKASRVAASPRGIALSGERVVVADRENSHISFYSRDLKLMKTILFKGKLPIGVACDEDSKVYVCDHDGNCVRVMNSQGQLLYSFSSKGSASSKLNEPYAICVHGELVCVTGWGSHHCVSVFTKEGNISPHLRIIFGILVD